MLDHSVKLVATSYELEYWTCSKLYDFKTVYSISSQKNLVDESSADLAKLIKSLVIDENDVQIMHINVLQ